MTSTTETVLPASLANKKLRPRLPAWLRNNPIIIKEMRSRMRGWRSFLGLTGFVVLLSAIVSLIYGTFTTTNSNIGVDGMRDLGRTIFFTVYGIELLVVCVVSPALTAGAISIEKEQQTYDLLRATLLSAKSLVMGKLISALSFALLFLLAALPLQSIGFMFGGLTIAEVLIGILILVLTALAFGTIGVFFSSFIPKTRIATAASQITSVVLTILIPAMTLFAMITMDSQLNLNNMSIPVQLFLMSLVWFVGASSPVATIIATEVILSEEQALFFFQATMPNNGPILNVPSPWIGFVIIYPILTFILLYVTIGLVQRTEK